MDRRRLVRASKYLSRHLRHEPERIGLELEPGGWVRVDDLLAACDRHRFELSAEDLRRVVAQNDKQRFSFDATGERIRANQGHSVPVDLELAPATPPELLYHGTGSGSLAAIAAEGLRPMGRHHVHLSSDRETAERVGRRHGHPVVLDVAAGRMHRDGSTFYKSANGVWLTDAVPPEYLSGLLPPG